MFPLRHALKQSARFFARTIAFNVVEHLSNRSVVRVSGTEASNFLQGLITNDVRHLDHGTGSMYAMFLNTKGRVMYDIIVYRTSELFTFLIECDSEVADALTKHLKLYRVRRKIDITGAEMGIYVVFNPKNITPAKTRSNDIKKLEGLIVPCNSLKNTLPESSATCKMYKDLLIYQDPRITSLGSRILAPNGVEIRQQISEIFNICKMPPAQHTYRWFRYNLGVGEGAKELPLSNCFPLEANGDYLHGVSFHKGCYIGQEVTARTHHTGVVRKRLMPIYFSKTPTTVPDDEKIVHENVNLGKLRGIEGSIGLGLLRINKALEFKEFSVGDGVASTDKPFWWPLEAPKERLSAQKG